MAAGVAGVTTLVPETARGGTMARCEEPVDRAAVARGAGAFAAGAGAVTAGDGSGVFAATAAGFAGAAEVAGLSAAACGV